MPIARDNYLADNFRNAYEQELNYGIGNAEVSWAIKNETGGKMDLNNMPIQLAVKDASSLPSEAFALIRRKGFGGSDASILVDANPYTRTYDKVRNRDGGYTDPLIVQKARSELTPEERAVSRKTAVKKGRNA
jgi:hypothetical protein